MWSAERRKEGITHRATVVRGETFFFSSPLSANGVEFRPVSVLVGAAPAGAPVGDGGALPAGGGRGAVVVEEQTGGALHGTLLTRLVIEGALFLTAAATTDGRTDGWTGS